MTVFQTDGVEYYFWVNLDDRCPHTVTVYPNFFIFTGVNCRSQFNMRYIYSYELCTYTGYYSCVYTAVEPGYNLTVKLVLSKIYQKLG
jgi:hypothetical protein